MAVAKVIELTAGPPTASRTQSVPQSRKAAETIHNIESAWVAEEKVVVQDGSVAEFRATVRITFVVD
jgi:flavin-binding protein dodecin